MLATICFLPAWYPYTPWIRGHNHLHHGWTNVAECDYSWRPVSPEHYRAMPPWRRVVERVYRSWYGLWLHSIVEIWWKHMALPREGDRRFLNARHLNADRVLVLSCLTAMAACCWFVAPRWSTAAGGPALDGPIVLALVILGPWWIFHVMFSVVTFLHHTHPRVPFRELPRAQRRLEHSFPADIIVERWSLASFVGVTKQCKLYDYEHHCWVDFSGQRTTGPLRTVTL